MHTITIDKTLQNDLAKASKLTGLNERELAHRAISLYLKRVNCEKNLAAEFAAWDDVSDEALLHMELELEHEA